LRKKERWGGRQEERKTVFKNGIQIESGVVSLIVEQIEILFRHI
jgi:hypothetical protein